MHKRLKDPSLIIHKHKTSRVPKYEQLINSIRNAIHQGILHQGDLLPTINFITENYPFARDTVLKHFRC